MVIDCRNSKPGIRLRIRQKLNSKGFKRCFLISHSMNGIEAINILPSKKWFYSKLKPDAKIDMTAEQYLNKN